MTETVTGYKMGIYLLYQVHEYGDWFYNYNEVIGAFTTLDNVNLAIDKLVKSGKKREDLSYRLVTKDELLIDLPSITEKPEDVYSW